MMLNVMISQIPLVGAGLTLDIDATFIVQMGLFLFVVYFLNVVLFRPYLKTWEARQQGVEGSREHAAETEAQAAVLLVELEQKMRTARRDAQEVRESLRSQGLQEQNDILEEVRQEVDQTLQQEREKISAKVASAQGDLSARAQVLAESIVKKLLPSA